MHSNSSAATGEFKWRRSENSFNFNFLMESTPSGIHSAQAPEKTWPGEDKKSDSATGFTFNFQIPTGTAHSSGMEAENAEVPLTQNIESTPESSNTTAGKKKKKKMKERGDDRPLKTITETTEEASKQENTELSPEQQLSRELDWCIEQLELGLRTQKSSNKQREEATRALKTLRSSKAPMVKKRQVMRAVSGDYRKKMDEERDRQFKLMHSAMTSAKVTTMSEPSHKSVFHCRALSKRPTASMENPQATHGPSPTVEPSEGECENFVFRPSHEEFCFNFDL